MTPAFFVFEATAPDAELRGFVRVLESGTEAEQRVAIDVANQRGVQTQLSLCARSIDANVESALQPAEELPAFLAGRYRATSVENDDTFEFEIVGQDVLGGVSSPSRRERRATDDLQGGSVDGSRLVLRVGLPVGFGHAKPERVVAVYFQAVKATPRGYEALMAMDSEDYWFDNRADRYIVARLTGYAPD
jgi:hypothetical protein